MFKQTSIPVLLPSGPLCRYLNIRHYVIHINFNLSWSDNTNEGLYIKVNYRSHEYLINMIDYLTLARLLFKIVQSHLCHSSNIYDFHDKGL